MEVARVTEARQRKREMDSRGGMVWREVIAWLYRTATWHNEILPRIATGMRHRFMSCRYKHELTGCFQPVDGHAARTLDIVVPLSGCTRSPWTVNRQRETRWASDGGRRR